MFHKVPHPEYSPGQCRTCGTHTAEYFVDMEYTEDFWGHVYYCPGCVDAILAAADIRSAKTSIAYIGELELKVDELEKEVSRDRLVDRLASRGVDLELFLVWLDAQSLRETAGETPEGTVGNARPARRNRKGSAESNSGEGSASVPDFKFGLSGSNA